MWPALAADAEVRLVTPASPTRPEHLEQALVELASWGLRPSVGRHIGVGEGMLAGRDLDRASDLMEALTDGSVQAVFCAAGGYGSLRLLDHLDWKVLAEARPKPVVGYSDNTALLMAIWSKLGWPVVHGPNIAEMCGRSTPDAESLGALRRALFSPAAGVRLEGTGSTVSSTHTVAGRLIGGNLTMLAAVLPSLPPPAGPIVLAIEDTGEAAYRVDRCLTQLDRSGWLDHVVAVVSGTWTDSEGADNAVHERADELGLPIVTGVPFGHGTMQLSLPLGVEASITGSTVTATSMNGFAR